MYLHELRKAGINLPLNARHNSKGDAKAVCPKCDSRKGGTREKDLSVNILTGRFRCHSAKCGWKGTVEKSSGRENYSRPQWYNRTSLPEGIVKAFEKRGISQETLQKMKVSVGEKGNVEYNYFRGEDLVNVKAAWRTKDGKKGFAQHAGAEKILYNLNSLEGKTKCIITEGENDVHAFVEAGLDKDFGVVSVDQGAGLPNSSLAGKLKCLENCAAELDGIEEFYICVDKDAPGQWLEEELIRRLGEYRCYIVDLPDGCKDANDVISEEKYGVIEKRLRFASLKLHLENARPVPVPGIQLLDDEMWEKMDYEYYHGVEKGVPTGMECLDENFSWLPGDVTLFTGIPNDGKSQFVRQLMSLMVKKGGWFWACYVPEDMPARVFYRDLCQIMSGKSVDKKYSNCMTIEEYNEVRAYVRQHFFLIVPVVDKKTGRVELPSNEWINDKIRFLKLKYGVNAYVKDPWNKIYHDMTPFRGREDHYLADVLSREKFFAAGFDAAILVAHPSKMQKNKDGTYPCPSYYDLSGGAMWPNMIDNIAVVYRPYRTDDPEDRTVEVHFIKIKKQSLVGKLGTVTITFDVPTKRYYNTNGTCAFSDAKIEENIFEKSDEEDGGYAIEEAQMIPSNPSEGMTFNPIDDIPF